MTLCSKHFGECGLTTLGPLLEQLLGETVFPDPLRPSWPPCSSSSSSALLNSSCWGLPYCLRGTCVTICAWVSSLQNANSLKAGARSVPRAWLRAGVQNVECVSILQIYPNGLFLTRGSLESKPHPCSLLRTHDLTFPGSLGKSTQVNGSSVKEFFSSRTPFSTLPCLHHWKHL